MPGSRGGRSWRDPALLSLSFLAGLVLLHGCDGRPPFLVLRVEDPDGLASGATSLHVGLTLETLTIAQLDESAFPLAITVTAEKAGERPLVVEARDASGTALARGTTRARFARAGTPTATVRLVRACATDADCSDAVFCNGAELCVEGMCSAGSPPCAANVGCATSTCSELGDGAGTCAVTVDHAACGTGKYCNPVDGCVSGKVCLTSDDCRDEYLCNGEETCINLVCVGGVPPATDDGSVCTLDGCNESEGVFHAPQASLDGVACALAAGGAGICLADHGGCVASLCGDGFVDRNASPPEFCDATDDDANDGCDACQRTVWIPEVVVGRGEAQGVATGVALHEPWGVAVDRRGNVFIADTVGHRVRRVDGVTGLVTTVAGTGDWGFSGDGGQATSAQLCSPAAVSVDGAGNLFIADMYNYRVRRIDGLTGIITTVAGTGAPGFSGDDGAATSAQLGPTDVGVDGAGNLFIADEGNHRIRRVDAVTGIITTVAGTGTPGFSGDGGAATSANLKNPSGVTVDGAGNLFIGDRMNDRVRRVDAETGIITTVAGTGASGSAGDGGAATDAQLFRPSAVTVDGAGNLFIADQYNERVRRVDGVTGVITTFAGTGVRGFSGDGGAAASAQLALPSEVACDGSGNLLISDPLNNRIRRVEAVTGLITTIAGTGAPGFSGDGGPATGARLMLPSHAAVDGPGNLFIADKYYHRIRRVDALTGIITTVAGTGVGGFSGDGGAATAAQLNSPYSVVAAPSGDLFIADTGNQRVRRVDGVTGVITTIAGTGTAGLSGNGGAATSAELYDPSGLYVNDAGDLFIADKRNQCIRRVETVTGVITAVAGACSATGQFSGDGGPATSAGLSMPTGVSVDADGNMFIADNSNHRIRRVDGVTGIITTIAGTGSPGSSGDAGAATGAQLRWPSGVDVDADGNVLIADHGNHRIRRIDGVTGIITTIAGTGVTGWSGDGGPATNATLYNPAGVTIDGANNLFIADENNYRIRRVDGTTGVITTVAGSVTPSGDGALASSTLNDPQALILLPDTTPTWLIADGVSGRIREVDLGTQRLGSVVGYTAGFAADGVEARYSRLLQDAAGLAYDATGGVLFVSERQGHTIRRVNVTAAPWTISTFAGALAEPAHADGDLASARFAGPAGLLFDAAARLLYVADSGNHVVRAIDVDAGTVSTTAGTPRYRGYHGEGAPAPSALLNGPQALARGPDGSLYIADTGNHRVRRVDAAGNITTVLGDGTPASSGQGAPARLFPVDSPRGLAVDGWGNLFITSRVSVRVVTAGADGVATGEDTVMTIYGAAPRDAYPESVTYCLTGLATLPDDTGRPDARLFVLDACQGMLLQLSRTR